MDFKTDEIVSLLKEQLQNRRTTMTQNIKNTFKRGEGFTRDAAENRARGILEASRSNLGGIWAALGGSRGQSASRRPWLIKVEHLSAKMQKFLYNVNFTMCF